MKIVFQITTLEGNNEYEPLMNPISTMKDGEATWKQTPMLLNGKTVRLNGKLKVILNAEKFRQCHWDRNFVIAVRAR